MMKVIEDIVSYMPSKTAVTLYFHREGYGLNFCVHYLMGQNRLRC